MRTYPEYKDSGVEWIGEIPSGWDFKKLKYLFDQNRDQINEGDLNDKDVIHYSIPNVQQYGIGQLENGTDILSNKFILKDRELLLSKLNPRKKTICISKKEEILSVGSTEFICLSPLNTNIAIRLFYYIFMTDEFTDNLDSMVESVTKSHQRIQPDEFLNIRCWFPSLSEQNQLSDYLDRKTQQIDDLIEKTERKIELLKEQRSSLINQFVTKGLDPNVEMKDSGVEWIGEIPKHWIRTRIKFYLNGVIDTEHKTVNFEEDGDYHVVRTSDIRDGRIKLEGTKKTDHSGYEEWTRRGVPETGDVLFTREAPAGECGVIEDSFKDFCMGQRVVWLKVKKSELQSRYLVYSIYSEDCKKFIQDLSLGSTVSHLNMSEIGNIPILYCPLKEQVEISKSLDNHEKSFRTSVDKLTHQISLLKEYRQSLISNVVTGKIDVRGEVIQ